MQSFASEVHGVPHGRPLPDLVEGALVAVCPELASEPSQMTRVFCGMEDHLVRSSVGVDTRDLRIPVATYLYDQRVAPRSQQRGV